MAVQMETSDRARDVHDRYDSDAIIHTDRRKGSTRGKPEEQTNDRPGQVPWSKSISEGDGGIGGVSVPDPRLRDGQRRQRRAEQSHRHGRHRPGQHGQRRPELLPGPRRRPVRGRVRREEGRSRREQNQVNGKYGNKDCKAYNDFREVLARGDIDAVHCATPDHWHALVVIEACRNGKDIYCQKPETKTLREGRLMIEAARRYSRVVSGGSQRVLEDYREIVDACWGGSKGIVKSINVNVGPLPDGVQQGGRARSRRLRLGHVARARPVGAVPSPPMQRQLQHRRHELAVVQGLLRRRHDRLGRPPFRRRDLRHRRPRDGARGSDLPQRKRQEVCDLPLSRTAS